MSKNMYDVKARNYSMVSHLALEDEHLGKYKGIFVCKGHPLHDKEFFKETHTATVDNKQSKCYYYLNEEESPVFDSIDRMMDHYAKPNEKD